MERNLIVQNWKFEKSGYRLWIAKKENGNFEHELKNIRQAESYFIPELYIGRAWLMGEKNVYISIQTTSYGALNEKEAKEFSREFQKGVEAMDYFNTKLDEIVNKK